ncbi:hypothetical protein AAU61_19210 [Desulfocarbo indianensis]|nr:hypothetical protein AAU61_19210 [Desulfocarbo indianensis]
MQSSQTKERLRRDMARRIAEIWPGESQGPLRPPDFPKAGQAAERLRRQAAYRAARVIAFQPDPALLQARINALMDGKTIIAATPGLKQGLVRISPDMIPVAARSRELTGHAMIKSGRQLRFPAANLGRVDMVVGACLAFDQKGRILGDGRGLLDLFHAILRHLGLKDSAPVAVLAADEQEMDDIPQEPWDLAANLVLTPLQGRRLEQERPKAGLVALPPELAALPVVRAVLMRKDQSRG